MALYVNKWTDKPSFSTVLCDRCSILVLSIIRMSTYHVHCAAICTSTCTHACVCVCVFVCRCAEVCVYACVHACLHTYLHSLCPARLYNSLTVFHEFHVLDKASEDKVMTESTSDVKFRVNYNYQPKDSDSGTQ